MPKSEPQSLFVENTYDNIDYGRKKIRIVHAPTIKQQTTMINLVQNPKSNIMWMKNPLLGLTSF